METNINQAHEMPSQQEIIVVGSIKLDGNTARFSKKSTKVEKVHYEPREIEIVTGEVTFINGIGSFDNVPVYAHDNMEKRKLMNATVVAVMQKRITKKDNLVYLYTDYEKISAGKLAFDIRENKILCLVFRENDSPEDCKTIELVDFNNFKSISQLMGKAFGLVKSISNVPELAKSEQELKEILDSEIQNRTTVKINEGYLAKCFAELKFNIKLGNEVISSHQFELPLGFISESRELNRFQLLKESIKNLNDTCSNKLDSSFRDLLKKKLAEK